MNTKTGLLKLLSIIFCLLIPLGCSNTKTPIDVETIYNPESHENLPIVELNSHNRTPLAVFQAEIDPVAKTFTITPVTREVQYHYPLTRLYPNCLQITGYGWTPNFWADIKLTHPLPGSGIDTFDPRVIAIIPANPGVRFIYPSLYIGGNNAVIFEPDGYTKLFDELGGSILGNVNPFVAYFKDVEYRRWSSLGFTDEIKRWKIDLNGFNGALQFILVVDVSTNYPATSTPIVDNAPEPVWIDAEIGNGLTYDGGSAYVTVTCLDWQGQSGIGGVNVEAPSLFDGIVNLSYHSAGINPNEYIYKGVISNVKLAPVGDYNFIIAAMDQSTSIFLYNEFSVEVKTAPIHEMILITAGEFTMGGWESNEGGIGPFTVNVPAFYISDHETTNAEYKLFVDATGHRQPLDWTNNMYPAGKADHPVIRVDWYDATAYCEWAGCRLPSEIEWEKAARGTDGRIFPWGNWWDVDKCRNYYTAQGGDGTTCNVWDYPTGRSAYGIYNMAGNVWEWTADWYNSAIYNQYKAGDLTPPPLGDYHVYRGGSFYEWNYSAFYCARRKSDLGDDYYATVGFRCARSL